MKTIPLRGCLGALFSFCVLSFTLISAGAASAQTSQQSAERARAAEAAQALKDATKLVQQFNMPCELVEASDLGQSSMTKDGKTVSAQTYEIACKDLRGYMISEYKGAPFGDPVSCNQALEMNKRNPASPACRLKPNRTAHYWLADIAKSKIPACSLGGARWISRDDAYTKETLEIACKNTAGGIFIVPTYKAQDKTVTFLNCLKVADTEVKCQSTTQEQAVQFLSPQVKKASTGCELNNARFIGATKDAEYYEVGCKDKPGFVLITDLQAQYTSAVGCDKAQSIGGCKFTDVQALAADRKAQTDAARATYAAALTKASVACEIGEFIRVGKHPDTGAEVVEFTCPEQPYGLVALIPPASSQTAFQSYDCFAAKTLGLACKLYGEDKMLAHLQTLLAGHKSVNADCKLTQARYAFMGNTGVVVMELACENKRGYIAVLNKARTSINPAVPCHVAATNDNVPEKCTIAGNGSNKS